VLRTFDVLGIRLDTITGEERPADAKSRRSSSVDIDAIVAKTKKP
jgi:hypothetical protein